MLPPEQMLNIQLAFWVNNPEKLTKQNQGKSQAEKLANLEEWQKVVAVKQKLLDAFQPRAGETDVFIHVYTVELRRYRGGKNLPNKSDPADALAMAAYGHDPDHKLETGELNMRYFLMHRPEPIDELRDLCQQLEHLNRVQSPIVNYARQLLAWQFPEVAHTKSVSTKPDLLPPLWGWLAKRLEISPAGKTRIENRYKISIAKDYGIEIDPILELHAGWMCDISLYEQRLEARITEMLSLTEFKPYMKVFDKFGFGLVAAQK